MIHLAYAKLFSSQKHTYKYLKRSRQIKPCEETIILIHTRIDQSGFQITLILLQMVDLQFEFVDGFAEAFDLVF